MENSTPQTPQPAPGGSFRRSAGSCLMFLLRLFLVLLLAVALGAGVYFGAPALYRSYVQPFERSLQKLDEAQSGQEQVNQQVQEQLQTLADRLTDLEMQSDTLKQSLDEARQSLETLEATRLSAEKATQEGEARDDALTTELADLRAALDSLETQLASLEAAHADTGLSILALESSLEDQGVPVETLRRELELVKVMEYLTRCRLFLSENNLGLASGELNAATALLLDLREQAPTYQQTALDGIIQRLAAAAANLPGRPILAAEDLEVAWQLLQAGLPASESEAQPAVDSAPLVAGTPVGGGTPPPTLTPTP